MQSPICFQYLIILVLMFAGLLVSGILAVILKTQVCIIELNDTQQTNPIVCNSSAALTWRLWAAFLLEEVQTDYFLCLSPMLTKQNGLLCLNCPIRYKMLWICFDVVFKSWHQMLFGTRFRVCACFITYNMGLHLVELACLTGKSPFKCLRMG